jgi:predicted nucleic acid-binding protein
MRYLLDTNILVFLITNDFDEINKDIKIYLKIRVMYFIQVLW